MASFDFPDDNDSNVPNREELLQMAIASAKAGNKEGARMMFRQVLSDDKRNERAMMWLAKLSASRDERHEWLSRVLTVNPNNQSARDALRRMNYVNRSKDNRVLLMFGVIAVILIILALVVIVAVASG
jgi:hypothetical protein